MPKRSSGILMYRRIGSDLHVLLVSGPFGDVQRTSNLLAALLQTYEVRRVPRVTNHSAAFGAEASDPPRVVPLASAPKAAE